MAYVSTALGGMTNLLGRSRLVCIALCRVACHRLIRGGTTTSFEGGLCLYEVASVRDAKNVRVLSNGKTTIATCQDAISERSMAEKPLSVYGAGAAESANFFLASPNVRGTGNMAVGRDGLR